MKKFILLNLKKVGKNLRLLKQKDNLLILNNVSEKVAELIDLTKLNQVLQVIENIEEAKDYIMFNELEKEL